MKKFILLVAIIIAAFTKSNAQAAWIEPGPTTDVTSVCRIYVDLSKITNTSLDGLTGPFYMWTWNPRELPANDPNVNGTGTQPWKNSNDNLKLTPDPSKGPKVYYYEMIPTDFYGVNKGDVYSKGISLLVKPKDGGGYGAPDLKSEDLNIKVNAPIERDTIYTLPKCAYTDEILTIMYNNPVERNTGMSNLGAEDCYLYIKVTLSDATTVEKASFFDVGTVPALKMTKITEGLFSGQFKLTMIPREFLAIPNGKTIASAQFIVRRKDFNGGPDRSAGNNDLKYFECK